MSICKTKFHGLIEFQPEQVLQVPKGLFGFPEEKQFLLLELPSSKPIVFIQSVGSQNLCFIGLPIQVVDAAYRLDIPMSDLEALGYAGNAHPAMGKELLCLAILTIAERRITTANLAAPLVIDIAGHRGMQVIVGDLYSHQHPFPTPRFDQEVRSGAN